MRDRFPIRTLHLLPELKEGGLERGVVEKAIWLQKHGIGAGVVSAGGFWLDRLSRHQVPHFRLPVNYKNPFHIGACCLALRRIIRDEGIHLVCAHSRAPAWSAHYATRRGGRHEPPLIIEAQGYYEPYFYSNVMRMGDRIIAVSGAIRVYMVTRLGASPCTTVVIPRGFAADEFPEPDPDARELIRREWGIPPDGKLVVGIGRLTHTKGWDDLIEAISLMPDPRPFCFLVGSSLGRRRRYVRKLKEMIKSLGLGQLVRFAGHREDVSSIYKAADVVAAPSRLPEPFGRVVIESIVFGCPVVTTEGCGAAEFLGDEYRRFLVPPGDPKALSERLIDVLSDLDAARRAVSAISATILTDLTIDKQMEATVKVYRDCRPDLPWPD